METLTIVIIVLSAFIYVSYKYGEALKALFFKPKSGKIKLACGHCVSCPVKKDCKG